MRLVLLFWEVTFLELIQTYQYGQRERELVRSLKFNRIWNNLYFLIIRLDYEEIQTYLFRANPNLSFFCFYLFQFVSKCTKFSPKKKKKKKVECIKWTEVDRVDWNRPNKSKWVETNLIVLKWIWEHDHTIFEVFFKMKYVKFWTLERAYNQQMHPNII